MKQRLYLDMDGVLADFDWGVASCCGKFLPFPARNDEEMWACIRRDTEFFSELPLMRDARKLFNYCNQHFDVQILTAIPKPKRGMPQAESQKRKWMRIHFGDVPVNVVYREHKKNFAKHDDGWTGPYSAILIDDSPSNVGQFCAAGGVGILHTNADDTIEVLSAYRKANAA